MSSPDPHQRHLNQVKALKNQKIGAGLKWCKVEESHLDHNLAGKFRVNAGLPGGFDLVMPGVGDVVHNPLRAITPFTKTK